jgi:hypothetical protein
LIEKDSLILHAKKYEDICNNMTATAYAIGTSTHSIDSIMRSHEYISQRDENIAENLKITQESEQQPQNTIFGMTFRTRGYIGMAGLVSLLVGMSRHAHRREDTP